MKYKPDYQNVFHVLQNQKPDVCPCSKIILRHLLFHR